MNKMSEIIHYFADLPANIGLLTETWQTISVLGKFDTFAAEIKDLALAEEYLINCLSCPRPGGGQGGGAF